MTAARTRAAERRAVPAVAERVEPELPREGFWSVAGLDDDEAHQLVEGVVGALFGQGVDALQDQAPELRVAELDGRLAVTQDLHGGHRGGGWGGTSRNSFRGLVGRGRKNAPRIDDRGRDLGLR